MFLTLLQCLEVNKSSFQPFPSDFKGVFVFYTPEGLCRKRRSWSKFCIIEDIVVSYTSKGLFTWREEDPRRWNNFTLSLHAEI